MKYIDMKEELFHDWSFSEAAHQEVALTGSQYLGSELDWLGEGKLRWWSWDRDGLG